jgi:hypothetical protein
MENHSAFGINFAISKARNFLRLGLLHYDYNKFGRGQRSQIELSIFAGSMNRQFLLKFPRPNESTV